MIISLPKNPRTFLILKGGIPILSEPSDTYGMRIKGDQKILIVDSFDRLSSWNKGQHFFVRSFGDALAANGVGFETYVNDAIQTGEVKLTDYDIVIYFCGDDSDTDESVAFIDQDEIERRMLKWLGT